MAQVITFLKIPHTEPNSDKHARSRRSAGWAFLAMLGALMLLALRWLRDTHPSAWRSTAAASCRRCRWLPSRTARRARWRG